MSPSDMATIAETASDAADAEVHRTPRPPLPRSADEALAVYAVFAARLLEDWRGMTEAVCVAEIATLIGGSPTVAAIDNLREATVRLDVAVGEFDFCRMVATGAVVP